jgi:hypothetical protein
MSIDATVTRSFPQCMRLHQPAALPMRKDAKMMRISRLSNEAMIVFLPVR